MQVYFVAVGSFALWVGVWGYLNPGQIAVAIPWQVPPLHARFIASMYLSGLVLMIGGFVTLRHRNVTIALWMAAIWTGMLLVVSLLHLAEFDYSLNTVRFWFGAYIAFPVAGAALAMFYRPPASTLPLTEAPGWAVAWLTAQGILCGLLALALFLAPTAMGALWPWKIPALLAQIYSGPFLSFAFGNLYLARHPNLADWRIALASMLAFSLLVVLASLIHRSVFGTIGPAATLWFGGFALASVVQTHLCLLAFRKAPP